MELVTSLLILYASVVIGLQWSESVAGAVGVFFNISDQYIQQVIASSLISIIVFFVFRSIKVKLYPNTEISCLGIIIWLTTAGWMGYVLTSKVIIYKMGWQAFANLWGNDYIYNLIKQEMWFDQLIQIWFPSTYSYFFYHIIAKTFLGLP